MHTAFHLSSLCRFELVWRPEAKVSMFDAVLPPRLYVPSALASPATAPCAGRFELVWRPEAKVSVFDSGFMLGDGVWEGIRLHRGVLLFLQVGCFGNRAVAMLHFVAAVWEGNTACTEACCSFAGKLLPWAATRLAQAARLLCRGSTCAPPDGVWPCLLQHSCCLCGLRSMHCEYSHQVCFGCICRTIWIDCTKEPKP